jgi:hypothetical protein
MLRVIGYLAVERSLDLSRQQIPHLSPQFSFNQHFEMAHVAVLHALMA